MPIIRNLDAYEILDSRGHPTLAVRCELDDGTHATASVPSGASTGRWEAKELRDGDPKRYRGLGCRKAVTSVKWFDERLSGRRFETQAALDSVLIELDGTPDKARLGANAILGVSLSFCRVVARSRRVALYDHLADMIGRRPEYLPRPTVNLFSGGLHAGGQVEVQDVLVTPSSATSIDEGMAIVADVYAAAIEVTAQRYGTRALVADEGGLAPPFPSPEAMLSDAVAAIERAGLVPGQDADLCVDVAASHFFREGRYQIGGQGLSGHQMIDRIESWVSQFPIVSVEDGLAEDDWSTWPDLRTRLGSRAIVVSDDLTVTTPARIKRAIAAEAANGLLLKVNQIGTVSEAMTAAALAQQAGWYLTVSARSGETEDDWLADLSVGWSGDQLKVGSITRSERLAKYNRLLMIERQSGLSLTPWPRLSRSPGAVQSAHRCNT